MGVGILLGGAHVHWGMSRTAFPLTQAPQRGVAWQGGFEIGRGIKLCGVGMLSD